MPFSAAAGTAAGAAGAGIFEDRLWLFLESKYTSKPTTIV